MQSSSPFSFHEGEALFKLANTYPTIVTVLLEEVQNCIDKGARRVIITINQKTSQISVRDDGDGVTQNEFEKALESVAVSIKKKDKMGRFGLGLISPLGKCLKFTFTSTPKSNPRGYLEWSFVAEDLRRQKKIEGIPLRTRHDLQFSRNEGSAGRGITNVSWRTEVRMENYTSDRQINRVTMESLRDGILDRFGPSMRRNETVVEVTIVDESGKKNNQEIRAKAFEGVKLEELAMNEKDSGRTNFQIYLARKTDKGRKGKVVLGESDNDYRLDFATFNRNLPEVCDLSEELTSALNSGFFEGEILNNRLKLDASRRSFEANDALVGFCAVLEKWFEDHGSKYYEEAKEQKQEERLQGLGVRSMKVIEQLLKQPAFANLLKTIDSFKKGSIGREHYERKGGKLSSETSISVQGNVTGKSTGGGSDDGPKDRPETENTSHRPMTVAGPKGSKRLIVRGNSLGLQYAYEAMYQSDNLYVLDEETGTMRFNILHPLFNECSEHSDKTLMRFQEHLTIQALTLKASLPEWAETAKILFDEFNTPYVFTLIHGDAIAGRQPGRPRSENVKTPTKPKLSLAKPKKRA